MKSYAGIGSRTTPPEVLELMTSIAKVLDSDGWLLNSGGADGADSAFEDGAAINRTIYLPSHKFNGRVDGVADAVNVQLLSTFDSAMATVDRFHPHPSALGRFPRLLMARNAYQVLGWDLVTPVKFVLCWTPDGAEGATTFKSGGTGQAIRIAKHHDIPVFNLANDASRSRVMAMLSA